MLKRGRAGIFAAGLFAAAMAAASGFALAASESTAKSEPGMIVLLKPIGSSPLSDAITARLEVNARQSQVDALQLAVVIENRGKSAVRLFDPKETFTVEMRTNEGWPVPLPKEAPRGLINRQAPPNGPDPDRPSLITIDAGTSYRFLISLPTVLGTPSDWKLGSQAAGGLNRIPPGTYQLKVQTKLVHASKEFAVTGSQALQSDSFSVQIQ